MRPQLDLKRMRYIVEVARAEAITSAAQTLSITQPALTRNIAEVEEELGIQIFHRLPRGIELTEEGKAFVVRAKQILGDVDNLVSEMKDNRGLPTGRLKIGAAPAGYVSYARGALEDLAREHPGVSVEVSTGSAQALCPRLLHGDLNVIVGSSSYLEKWRELELHRLTPLDSGMLMRKGHPLSKVSPLHEVDILKCPVLLPASVEPVYSDTAQRYAENNLPPVQPRYAVDDWELTTQIINATDAFFPLTNTPENLDALAESFFVARDIVKMPKHFVSIAYSPSRPKTALTELFQNLMQARLGP
ncbi:MAG: LysR family transcriptional regulator [Proteobacteria bacterium]|jgi:DNA-binding transcriptional LysR family regulator|nr:LysR family transcriptional regulator [Pseudomonadota bacterium]MDA1299039.1 LysR family transcriptional regulator [Pseudomonadota bacterium]